MILSFPFMPAHTHTEGAGGLVKYRKGTESDNNALSTCTSDTKQTLCVIFASVLHFFFSSFVTFLFTSFRVIQGKKKHGKKIQLRDQLPKNRKGNYKKAKEEKIPMKVNQYTLSGAN